MKYLTESTLHLLLTTLPSVVRGLKREFIGLADPELGDLSVPNVREESGEGDALVCLGRQHENLRH